MEELLEASKLLKACLNRYISACSAATAFYNPADNGDHDSPLLNAITDELRVVTTYEKDVRNAQSILSRGRNTSPALVPISSLPSEVLEWIFELAYHTWLRSVDIENFEPIDGEDEDVPEDYIQYDMNVKLPSPMFPEGLAHVCARWRQVVLHSRRLWSRIDLPIFSHSYTRLLLRGKTFASRATPLGLDVHILMANGEMESSPLSRRLDRFCASVGSGIKSLQLTNGVKAHPFDYNSHISYLLRTSFAHLTPGTLDHLALIDQYPSWSKFIKSTELTPDSARDLTIPINLPQCQIDEVLRPIRSLWLKNCFFPWKSPAYYGLVDLRLLQSGKKRPISIESTQLRDILSACPKLRTFQCSIEIKRANTTAQVVSDPVYLPELEDLHLRRLNHAQQQYILPLITPGPKPLSLSIQVAKPTPTENLFSTTVLDFFTRSNVTALNIERHDYASRSLSLKRLLKDSPKTTRIIGLQGFDLNQGNVGPMDPGQSYLTQLDCLNLMECVFRTENLRQMVAVCPVRMVKLLELRTLVDDEGRMTWDSRTLDRLVPIFPVVKCVNKDTPLEEWNSWGIVEWEWR